MRPYGWVYLITSLSDGKFYVGQTTRLVSTRWAVHKSEALRRPESYFHKAIRLHGPESFDVQTVASAGGREELLRLERLWILMLGAHKRGYNLTIGGEGAHHSREVVERIAAQLRGRTLSAEHRAKISAAGRGRRQSDDHRAARSVALKGRQTPTAACRAAVARANRLRTPSPETRAKLSEAAKKANRVRWGS